MKIEPIHAIAARENVRQTSRVNTQSNNALPDFEQSRSLDAALAESPDVRAEAVARGKALIADPNYPSQEQIKKMSHLLAAHLTQPNSRPVATGVDNKQTA
jgi:hypothetical protein